MWKRVSLLFFFSFVLWGALITPPLIPGQTQPSSPIKPQSLQNSAEHLTVWDRLSKQFDLTLQQHEITLIELSGKLEASESNGQRLTDLLERLSTQNESLKQYNEQIGERMMERDIDLVAAYTTIDELRSSRWIWLLIGVGIPVSLYVGLKIFRLFYRVPS